MVVQSSTIDHHQKIKKSGLLVTIPLRAAIGQIEALRVSYDIGVERTNRLNQNFQRELSLSTQLLLE